MATSDQIDTTFTDLIMDAPSETAAPVEEQPADEVETAEAPEVAEVEEPQVDDDPVEEPFEAEPAETVAQETTESDEADEAPLYSVKVDGVSKDVTLDELMRGYSGQEYVQKGMEEASGLRKNAQEAYDVLQSELAAVRDLRTRMEQGSVISAPPAPNPEAFQNDPMGYMEAKMEYDGKMEAYQADTNRLGQLEQAENVRRDRQHQAYLAQQLDVLQKRIPAFADPQKAPALQTRIVQAGQNYYGFSEAELRGEGDARRISVLHDAMRYRELQAAGKGIKPNKAKPVIRTGTARTEVTSKAKQRHAAKSKMQKTGDMNSVIDFLTS